MQAADKTDAVIVAVSRDGILSGNNQVAADQLAPKVKDLLANRVDHEVFLRADSRARFEKVVEVVNNLRAAGVDQLGLLTEQIQERRPGQPGAAPGAGARRASSRNAGLEGNLWEWQ
jgi:biopolymer transport protein ExbD/biopolymer transport protein TolR